MYRGGPSKNLKIKMSRLYDVSREGSHVQDDQPVVVLEVERKRFRLLFGVRFRATTGLSVTNHKELLVDVNGRIFLVLNPRQHNN